MISSYNILIGKPEGRRLIGRRRRSWEDNIRIDLRETGVVWIHLAQNRDTVMNL
jgi:hypothetical protein